MDKFNFRQKKFGEAIAKYSQIPKECEKKIYWYYGETGTGKTRRAVDEADIMSDGNYYMNMETFKNWNLYLGEEVIIIDNLKKHFGKLDDLIKLISKEPYKLNTGIVKWSYAKTIFITSLYHPNELYGNHKKYNELIDKIKEIKKFEPEKKFYIYF